PGAAGARERKIGSGIVGAGFPNGRPAVYPRIAGPGFVAWLARPRHGVEAPNLLAGIRVPCADKPADAEFAAGNARDDLVLDRQRRVSHGVALLRIGDLSLPDLLACLRANGDQPGVERGQKHLV